GLANFREFDVWIHLNQISIVASSGSEVVLIKSNDILNHVPVITFIYQGKDIQYVQFLDQKSILLHQENDQNIYIHNIIEKTTEPLYAHSKPIKNTYFYRINQNLIFYDGEEVYSITGHFSDWNIEWVKTMPLNGGSDSRLFVFNNIVWLSVDGKGLVFSD